MKNVSNGKKRKDRGRETEVINTVRRKKVGKIVNRKEWKEKKE